MELKFIRLDYEVEEPEVVFEVLPSEGNGAYRKNRWFVRYPLCFSYDDMNKDLIKMVEKAQKEIGLTMGFKIKELYGQKPIC